jgi:uncharacterized membrane protein YjjP (DUF1212 family)
MLQASDDSNAKRELFITVAKALHHVGFSSHFIELRLSACAQRLGWRLDAISLPTGILLTLFDNDRPTTYVLRDRPAGVNLERMTLLTKATSAFIGGELSPEQAKAQIDEIMRAPQRWGSAALIVAYVLSGGAFAVFFGGGLCEVIVATLVGLTAGLLAVAMRRWRITTRLFELIAAAAAAMVVEIAGHFFGPFVQWIPIAAGLIILLPGISLLDSVSELSHGHLESGAARLAGVGVAFLALAFGTVAGTSFADLLPELPQATHSQPLGAGWTLLALIVVAFGSMIRFRARPRDLPIIFAASLLALYVTQWETEHMGGLAGPFLAALLLGLAGNAFGKLARGTPELVVIPAIALLVPGSIGVLSLSSLLAQNTTAGIDAVFQMFLKAMALASGILFSQSLVRDQSSE